MYTDFEMQGIEEDKLQTRTYLTIMDRIKIEEAAAAVSNGLHRENDDFEYGRIATYRILCNVTLSNRDFSSNEVNNGAKSKGVPVSMNPRGSISDGANYVSRIQNATSNVMGRISGLGRGVGGIGGIANKFLNNL